MSKLAAWIEGKKSEGLTRSAFAELIGITPGALTRLCTGENGASLKVANKIAEVTKGEIVPADLERAPRVEAAQ